MVCLAFNAEATRVKSANSDDKLQDVCISAKCDNYECDLAYCYTKLRGECESAIDKVDKIWPKLFKDSATWNMKYDKI